MSEPRLRFGRIVGYGLLAEVAVAVIIVSVLQVHAHFIAAGDEAAIATFGQRAPAILGPGLGVLFTFLAAQFAARPVPDRAVAHGLAVGIVTSLLTVPGMFAAPPLIPIYAGAIVLKLAAGWAAGATIEWRGSQT